MNAEFALRRQTEAARELLASLRADGAAEDAEIVASAVEGETDLHEAIEAALAEIDECEVIEVGAKAKAAEFAGRASSASARAERVRAMIERALLEIEASEPLRLPGATVSLSKRPRQVVVTDESQVPSRFFVEQERPAPKLDKKALAAAIAALPDGQTIPGATLDNGSVSLLVRRK